MKEGASHVGMGGGGSRLGEKPVTPCGCRFRPGAPATRALDTTVQGVDFMLN